jgi:hypothetical protein
MPPTRPSGFKFDRLDSVGAPDAEMDQEFLDVCYLDTGDLAVLSNQDDRRVILLGRTGTGKSALLHRLRHACPDQVITIYPEALALSHVANSQILSFVSNLGINLDPLFKLLWRHVFVVELLRYFFQQHSSDQQEGKFIQWIQSWFPNEGRESQSVKRAIDYLREWGESFWEHTEYRVKEITHTIETQLEDSIKATLGSRFASVAGNLGEKEMLTSEERAEVNKRAQEVVSKAQVHDLSQVLKVLDQVLSNRQHPYFVVVDHLDENWVEDKFQYQLIKTLVLISREFIGIRNAKIVIAIRRDLIERVFRLTRDPGFQEEKITGNYLQLTWTRDQILGLLDARVQHLVSRRYTKQPVHYQDVLPEEFEGAEIGTAIYRLAHRPRDVIALFNCCIQAGQDKAYIGTREFSVAVGEYSRGRLKALADEWHGDFPQLLHYVDIFKGLSPTFKISSVTDDQLIELCLKAASECPVIEGQLHSLAHGVVEQEVSAEHFREALFYTFYKCGLVGLKVSADAKAAWIDAGGQSVGRTQMTNDTSVSVHPAYTRALGMRVG